MPQSTVYCYLCDERIYDLADAEIFNVKIFNLYHVEIGHKTCVNTEVKKA